MLSALNYLNPLTRLGNKKYSVRFPIVANIAVSLLSEFIAHIVLKNPNSVGSYIIFVNVGLIIYFSFRDGIRGGFITTFITIFYYLYIIQSRGYSGQQWDVAVETTFVLMILYLVLAATIGWLKQRIDNLIVEEITSRQQAEEQKNRLETILQQLPVGVILADSKGKLEGNKQVETILGNSVKGQLQNNNYVSRFAYQKNKPMLAKDWPIVRALKKGEIVTGEEITYVTKKKKMYLRVNAAPINNTQKQIVAAVSTIDDITPEKELEMRKDDFVNMASHELKTPLTSLKIYNEVLANIIKKHHDQTAEKTISSIQTQTERLQELVSDLLDVSRIQTGKLRLNKEYFMLNDLLEEVIEVLQGTTKQKITLIKSPAVEVKADRFRIYQVITNLLTNAIKYSPEGKKIELKITKAPECVHVSVKDQGIGIHKEQQKKIFDKLYQVKDPSKRHFSGLGIGLYISKEIIRRHKGEIWVEGDHGKGSTFFFTLPI